MKSIRVHSITKDKNLRINDKVKVVKGKYKNLITKVIKIVNREKGLINLELTDQAKQKYGVTMFKDNISKL